MIEQVDCLSQYTYTQTTTKCEIAGQLMHIFLCVMATEDLPYIQNSETLLEVRGINSTEYTPYSYSV